MINNNSENGDVLELNSAAADDLAQLPGVGPALAERIIAGRPYAKVDDLRRVSGLGASTLDRLKGSVEVKPVESEAPKDMPSPVGRRATPPQARRTAPSPATYSRRQVVGLLAIGVVLSVVMSISLTLATLLGINGTLDVGRSRSVLDLQTQTGGLETQVQSLRGRLDALDQRVQSLQGLTGRMSQVESQTTALGDDVRAAQVEAERLAQQVDDLSATARDLEARQTRQESVFQGLADLLAPWAGQSTPTPIPTPESGG